MANIEWPDIINSGFETFGGCLVWLSVRRLLIDRTVHGVSLMAVVGFTLWGYWNIFYYPYLEQWYSLVGCIIMVSGNTTWILLAYKFRNQEKQ